VNLINHIPHPEGSHYEFGEFGKIGLVIATPIFYHKISVEFVVVGSSIVKTV
jgi:hypothetical protein